MQKWKKTSHVTPAGDDKNFKYRHFSVQFRMNEKSRSGYPAMAKMIEPTDTAASHATAYAIDVREYFKETLSPVSDHDKIAVNLTAGQTHGFGLVGTGALNQSVNHTT